MEYADRLRRLDRPDLEQLLVHRPETSALAGRHTASYDDLAGLLALPVGTARAVASLDRFHRQVLELVCLAGGRLEPEFADAQGLEPERLTSAAAELARWGLGFQVGRDLWVPPFVLGAVDDPGRVGPRAASLLQALPLVPLRTMASTLGVLRMIQSKADLVAAIADRLRDGAFVRELVAGAPPRATLVLEALRGAAGGLYWSELAQLVPSVHTERNHLHSVLRPADDGIAWLRCRALVHLTEWDRRLVVPAEVEVALRGRLFAGWEPEPPPLELVALEPDRHPVDLVIEVDGLLDLWREPVALLQSGDLGVRECHRVGSALGVPEGTVRFLASLAISAGLLAVEQPPPARASGRGRGVSGRQRVQQQTGRLVLLDEAADDWRSRSVPERWADLVGRWCDLVDRTEAAMGLVLDELVALPAGQGASLPSLARRLAWRHPGAFPDADAAISELASTTATLHRLGVGAGAASVGGVSELGRAALRGCAPAELAPLVPPTEPVCTITADLRVIVAGPSDPELARGLSRLADLETASPARVYRLSESSLRRALDDGMGAVEMADFLRARCPTGVPQNVAALIDDVGRRHGRLRVGRASVYLLGDDPALLAAVAADRRLSSLRVRILAPTVAVVDGADEAQALAALRRAGHMPGVEGGRPADRPRAAARRRPAPPPRPARRPPGPAELADSLLATRPRAAGAGRNR